MAKEGFMKRFMEKKPLLYCTLILALIAVVCGALLGFGNKYLYVEKDNSGSLGVIFNVLTGTKDHTVIFDKSTADEFTVGAEKIKIEKSKRDEAKVEAAYRIENGGKTYILIMASGKARNAGDGQLKVITAYIADPAGKPESDKIAGSRPYEAPASEYKNAYNKKFFDSFSGKTADSDVKLSDTDGYTGATVTAGGLVEAVNNASAFYKLYRNNLMGVADSPFVKALKKAYKFAASATETAFTGLPAGIKLYMTNDGLPMFDVAADGYNIILSFADKHGFLGGAAVYNKDGGDVSEALAAASEKAAGKYPLDPGFAASLGEGASVEDMAALISGAYNFFATNRIDILKANKTFDAALIAGLNKIAYKALPASTVFEYAPILGMETVDGLKSRNTVQYAKDKNYYYSTYCVYSGGGVLGLYIILTSIPTYGSDVLVMTAVDANAADGAGILGKVKEMMVYDINIKEEVAMSEKAYIDNDGFLKASWRGMLGNITASNYRKEDSAENGHNYSTDINKGADVWKDPTNHIDDNPTSSATVTINKLAENIVDAVDIYRILTA